jgi:hypothetical protein
MHALLNTQTLLHPVSFCFLLLQEGSRFLHCVLSRNPSGVIQIWANTCVIAQKTYQNCQWWQKKIIRILKKVRKMFEMTIERGKMRMSCAGYVQSCIGLCAKIRTQILLGQYKLDPILVWWHKKPFQKTKKLGKVFDFAIEYGKMCTELCRLCPVLCWSLHKNPSGVKQI